MKAKDLMIGDWYAFRGHPYKCTANDIASLAECEEKGAPTDISEIPLTPEILEKNGFVCSDKSSRKPYQLRNNSNYVSVIKGRFNARNIGVIGKPMNAMQIDCNYIHELQHALRLCGIDKEIVI